MATDPSMDTGSNDTDDRALWTLAVYVPAGRETELAELLDGAGFEMYRMYRPGSPS
ncbi:hypothetical protein ACWEN6_13685 [Sphaerisporangium sp. NPDC004334]